MASSWTKCNPEDPSTYPDHRHRVMFVTTWPFAQVVFGAWEPSIKAWCDQSDDQAFPWEHVTHWQPLPALPGEELAVDEDLAKVLGVLEAGLADGSSVFGPMVSTALRVGARVEPPDAARKVIAAARRALAVKKAP